MSISLVEETRVLGKTTDVRQVTDTYNRSSLQNYSSLSLDNGTRKALNHWYFVLSVYLNDYNELNG